MPLKCVKCKRELSAKEMALHSPHGVLCMPCAEADGWKIAKRNPNEVPDRP